MLHFSSAFAGNKRFLKLSLQPGFAIFQIPEYFIGYLI